MRPLQLVKKAAKLLLREALPDKRALVLRGIAGLFAKRSAVFGATSPVMPAFYCFPCEAFLLGRLRALTKSANAKIAQIKRKTEISLPASAHLQSAVTYVQVNSLALQAFSSLWRSVDFVNILSLPSRKVFGRRRGSILAGRRVSNFQFEPWQFCLRPPLPVSAEILRISGRRNCKEAIFVPENRTSQRGKRFAPAHTPPETLKARKGFRPPALSRGFLTGCGGRNMRTPFLF